jgi:hypothetical protein
MQNFKYLLGAVLFFFCILAAMLVFDLIRDMFK